MFCGNAAAQNNGVGKFGSFRVGMSFQACGKYRGQWDKLSLINIRVSQRDKGVAKKIIRILNG